MNNDLTYADPAPMQLGPDKLRSYFLTHLNKIYCAKSHLAERLPDIILQSHFKDLKQAIAETLEDVEKQIVRMDEIYSLLDDNYSFESCNGLIGLMEDSFTAIDEQETDYMLRDLAILFYMQHIESVEMASFQVLQIAAAGLKNKQIKQLLLENFDEAKADRALLLLIIAKYVSS